MIYPRVRPAVLSDVNEELVTMYRAVQRSPEAVLGELDSIRARFLEASTWERFKEVYRGLRDDPRFVRSGEPLAGVSDVEVAARMIALNKTCHNGLFRQNKSGRFNVPAGRKTKSSTVEVPIFAARENLLRVHEALDGADIVVMDVVAAIEAAMPGELVYIDPPYWPAKEGGFTGYVAGGFAEADHHRVVKAALEASARGVLIAISNHDLPATRNLYRGFHVAKLMVPHQMNRDGTKRGAVPELLATTFPTH